jgi:hypothetical protein
VYNLHRLEHGSLCTLSYDVFMTDLVPLSALASEGFGWDAPFVTTPADAIAVVATRYAGDVVLDDLGRRCVSRDVARRLFAERAAAEAKQRQQRERLDVEMAEREAANRPWAGVPAGLIPAGMTPVGALLLAGGLEDAPQRRRSVVEDALDNDGITYHSIGPGQS